MSTSPRKDCHLGCPEKSPWAGGRRAGGPAGGAQADELEELGAPKPGGLDQARLADLVPRWIQHTGPSRPLHTLRGIRLRTPTRGQGARAPSLREPRQLSLPPDPTLPALGVMEEDAENPHEEPGRAGGQHPLACEPACMRESINCRSFRKENSKCPFL